MIDRLPPELLDLILQSCDCSSLRNLRLVSSWTRDLSTPSLFEHVYLTLFDDSLDNFNRISRSHLAQHVKTVIYFSDSLPQYTRQEWEGHIDRRPLRSPWADVRRREIRATCPLEDASHETSILCDVCRGRLEQLHHEYETLPRHDFSARRLDDAWSCYSQLCWQQRQWREDYHGMLFKESFALLPNVNQARVSNAATCLHAERNETAVNIHWTRLCRLILLGPESLDCRTRMDDTPIAGQGK